MKIVGSKGAEIFDIELEEAPLAKNGKLAKGNRRRFHRYYGFDRTREDHFNQGDLKKT